MEAVIEDNGTHAFAPAAFLLLRLSLPLCKTHTYA